MILVRTKPPRLILFGAILFLFVLVSAFPVQRVAAQNPAYRIHVVRVGESLTDIAQEHGIDVERLCWLNSLSCQDTSSTLTAGTVLRIGLRQEEASSVDSTDAQVVPVEPVIRPPLSEIVDDVVEVGLVRVYDRMLNGRPTMSGELYDPKLPTVSHRTLPFDTVVILYNPKSGRSTFARVNDRGPLDEKYMLDVSERIAFVLGLNEYDPADIEMRTVFPYAHERD